LETENRNSSANSTLQTAVLQVYFSQAQPGVELEAVISETLFEVFYCFKAELVQFKFGT